MRVGDFKLFYFAEALKVGVTPIFPPFEARIPASQKHHQAAEEEMIARKAHRKGRMQSGGGARKDGASASRLGLRLVSRRDQIFQRQKDSLQCGVGAEVRRRRKQLRWSQSRLANFLRVAGLAISRCSPAKVECGVVWVGDLECSTLHVSSASRVQELFPKIAVQEPLNGALTTILGTSPDMLKRKQMNAATRASNARET